MDAQTNIADETLGFYSDLAYGNGTLVAVGGAYADRFTLSVSEDGGYSWTEIDLPEAETTPYSRLDSVAYNEGLWMVTSNRTKMYQSTNGLDWDVVTTEDAPFALHLLGAHHGLFFGVYNTLLRSENGIDWTVLHAIPDGQNLTAMTTQRWGGGMIHTFVLLSLISCNGTDSTAETPDENIVESSHGEDTRHLLR